MSTNKARLVVVWGASPALNLKTVIIEHDPFFGDSPHLQSLKFKKWGNDDTVVATLHFKVYKNAKFVELPKDNHDWPDHVSQSQTTLKMFELTRLLGWSWYGNHWLQAGMKRFFFRIKSGEDLVQKATDFAHHINSFLIDPSYGGDWIQRRRVYSRRQYFLLLDV